MDLPAQTKNEVKRHEPVTSLLPVQRQWTSVLLNHAASLAQQHFTQALSTLHITARQFGALSVLANKGPLTQIELGRLITVDRNTMVSLTDDLEQLGLVQRCRHPHDRRAYAITLTANGQHTFEQANKLAKGSEEDFYASLSETDVTHLRSLLLRLIETQETSPERK
ncbi:MarR family winged helix-turn-helix transcriptional regulator [Dictyobacter kobayashii]|uniref:HTH marR-type domain-containing protein n=1 Tax=Dictyobacter kobayashii TaxID=2014872 RepID=A0A402AS27_9CHLR|nr:MarR family transcriptional regulator [Dictyobacter kobayashii]GCE21905.1 hypothetical protein KDK_57050 [Dictyobacter kobayashii]